MDAEKKIYSSPELVEHGDLVKLTHSGPESNYPDNELGLPGEQSTNPF